MDNLFLTSGSCDSFEDGVLVTTLPSPLDIREGMGINLCELSFGGLVNIPGGLDFSIGNAGFRTVPMQSNDIKSTLNELAGHVRGHSFKENKKGYIVANFPAQSVMRLGRLLQKITGWGPEIRNGDTLESGWDLWYMVPYLIVELSAVKKSFYGVRTCGGLRMVPVEYKNDWGNFRFEFAHPVFVPMMKGEVATLRLCLRSRFGVVDFLTGGSLQAHLQISPVTSRLLV
jgi:hypothetical protein